MKKLAILFTVLFSAAAFTQDLPRIAVYITGDVPDNEKKALGTRMLTALVNSMRYKGIERSSAFLAEIEKEHVRQRSGDIDDNQISALGKQFGVKSVCIADITPAFGEYQVSARIINVETAEVEFIGEATSPLRSMADLAQVSEQVVKNMFGWGWTATPAPKHTFDKTPEPAYNAAPKYTPERTPEPAHNTAPQYTSDETPEPPHIAGQYELPENFHISTHTRNDNFTVGQRFKAIGLNLLVPGFGLGSLLVMLDGVGALTQIALLSGGGLCMLFSHSTHKEEERPYHVAQRVDERNDVLYYTGLGAVSVGITYAILRPAFKKKPNYMASLENSDVNFVVLPDKDGNIMGYVAYRVEF
jgi:hypothetical protein